MKYLIVFMSHHGTTKKVVGLLAEKLGTADTVIVDLDQNDPPPLAGFDTVIVGGSIHIGKIQKKIRKFCEQRHDELLQKKLGLFLCFMDTEHGSREFGDAFPEDLRKHATACGLFGGELLLEEMNFLEKMMVKKMSGIQSSVSKLDDHAIASFTAAMQNH